MAFVASKDFKTVNQRFKKGDVITEGIVRFEDLQSTGHIKSDAVSGSVLDAVETSLKKSSASK